MEPDNIRQDMVDQMRAESQQRTRAPRVHRVAASPAADKPLTDERGGSDTPDVGNADAPRKRRRRRRSGGTNGSGSGEGTPGSGGDQ